MKKIILLTALLVSVVCGKSMEQIQSEWQEKFIAIAQKQKETFQQSDELQRLAPHCFQNNDKYCQNGFVANCAGLAQLYSQGNEQFGIKIDENKAKSYADKVCNLDAAVCVSMSGTFINKNEKLSLQYAEKACEMGEMVGCFTAGLIYTDEGSIGKNPQKIKYYKDKLCKAGVEDFCK